MRSTSFALLLLLPLLGCDPGPDAEVVFGDVDELPGTLSYAVVEGSDPAAQNLQITNTGTCTLDYTIEAFTADQRPGSPPPRPRAASCRWAPPRSR